jgi:hypothetical protein
MHPSVQYEGEVVLCADAWHASTLRGRQYLSQPALIVAMPAPAQAEKLEYRASNDPRVLGHFVRVDAPAARPTLEQNMAKLGLHHVGESGDVLTERLAPAQAAEPEERDKDGLLPGWRERAEHFLATKGLHIVTAADKAVLNAMALIPGDSMQWCDGISVAMDDAIKAELARREAKP